MIVVGLLWVSGRCVPRESPLFSGLHHTAVLFQHIESMVRRPGVGGDGRLGVVVALLTLLWTMILSRATAAATITGPTSPKAVHFGLARLIAVPQPVQMLSTPNIQPHGHHLLSIRIGIASPGTIHPCLARRSG